MIVRPGSLHHQVAYVTRDIERAMAICAETYGIERFYRLPMPEVPGGPKLKVALANVGGTEIELIEPIGDSAPLYSDPLQGENVSPMLFHHVANRIEGTLDDWNRYRTSIDEDVHPVVFQGEVEAYLRFIYTDERARLGHYLEHMWMSPELLEQMHAMVPRFP